MPRSSNSQGSFAGGQWGPASAGRFQDPRYMTALSLCLNGFPMEETDWTVRSGTMFTLPTVGRTYAKMLTFSSAAECSFGMEFTDGKLRFDTLHGCICTNDGEITISSTSVNMANHIVVTVSPSMPADWNNGDLIQLVPPSVGNPGFPFDPVQNMFYLQNRVLSITSISGNTFILADDLGNLINGVVPAFPSGALKGCQIVHHLTFATGYTTVPQLQALRAVQAEIDSVILSSTNAPFVVQITTEGSPTNQTDPVFAYEQLNFMDGPYLDPQAQTLTISSYSGTITCTSTIGSATTANVFAATDVGRSIRIFTQPPIYNPASTYTTGQAVTDINGAWWVALQNISAGWLPGNLATISGIPTVVWGPNPGAGTWAWGTIATYSSPTVVTVTLDTRIPGMVLNSANSDVAYFWQLGVYSDTTGWPTCGGYFQGRLWLAGAVANRFDTCVSNGIPPIIGQYTALFSPTDPNNNVLDNSGMSYILDAGNLNEIQWMLPDAGGLLMGTEANEFLIGASTLYDPITPTSIQDYPRTEYGSINQDAIRVGMAAIFTHRNGRRVMEYIDDAFSTKPTGRHLNENAKNLSISGVALLAYTEEPVPMVWALMNNGMLTGCTYRRFSRFVQTPPEACGWHWNVHGGGRVFTSMCAVPSNGGTLDYLFTVTNQAAPPGQQTAGQSNYYVEILQPPAEPPLSILTGFLADQAGGWAPGNTGTDCGGMNPTGFTPSGYSGGGDTTRTTVTNNNFFDFTGYTSGQSPPWGAINILGEPNSVFFPGSVYLSNIPPWNLVNSTNITDVTEYSISVWVGTMDSTQYGGQGALICPPHLDMATWTSTPGIIGAEFLCNTEGSTGPTDPIALVEFYGTSLSSATLPWTPDPTTPPWSHLMISVSINNSTGVVNCTAYVNDTAIAHNLTIGTLTDHGAIMGPFSSSPEGIADDGLNIWTIGGQAQTITFDPRLVPNGSTKVTVHVEGLLELMQGTAGFSANSLNGLLEALTTGPNAETIAQAMNGFTYTITEPAYITTFDGGVPNPPYPTTTGNYMTGYIGNVAELWVMPGSFIDWSNAGNRAKFHETDGTTWGPVPIGFDGSTPTGTKPWIYLSGGPPYFYINRAPSDPTLGFGSVALTELDTTSSIIDYSTGLGGGLKISQLDAL